MAKEPVTIQTYALNTEALQAQQYLKNKGLESFIFMESSWTGRGQDSHQRIRLVARPVDAERAISLLAEQPVEPAESPVPLRPAPEGGMFFKKAGWMLTVLFIFYFVSSLRDGVIDQIEAIPAGVFFFSSIVFFVLSNLQSKQRKTAPAA